MDKAILTDYNKDLQDVVLKTERSNNFVNFLQVTAMVLCVMAVVYGYDMLVKWLLS